jgi:rhodanese-related sulfurtransferase
MKSRDEFIRQMTSNLPARPDYFLEDAAINRTGATPLSDLPELMPLSAADVKNRIEHGEIALDVRPADDFAARHVPGSINIALSGQFASWAGAVLGLAAHPILIADTSDQISEARLRLARVGIESVPGFLEGGVTGWQQAGYEVIDLPQLTVEQLNSRLGDPKLQVVDVRRQGEWDAGHIEGVDWYPLDRFKAALPPLEKSASIAVHCKSGYRSMIAASLLQRAGFNVMNVIGGFDQWEQAKLPVSTEAPVHA